TGLDLLERHPFLLPQLGAFPALAIGEAHDRDVITLGSMCRDGAATAPDEVSRVSADNESGFFRHVSKSFSTDPRHCSGLLQDAAARRRHQGSGLGPLNPLRCGEPESPRRLP